MEAFEVVPELSLFAVMPPELDRAAERTRALLDEALPHQQWVGALTKHNPYGGAVLVKIIRKETPNADVYGKLAELMATPERLFDFAYAWGDDEQLYGYYALCKMRPAARTGKSTAELIELRKQGEDHFEQDKLVIVEIIDGVVMSPEERDFGDFDHKGAVIVENDEYCVLVGVSGFSEDEDHLTAEYVAKYVLLQLAVRGAEG